jgi:hypothetical protein
MRPTLIALRATCAATVLVVGPVLGTTAAQAHDSVRVTVIPSTVAPGGTIEIRAEGCKGRTAVATSRVFDTDAALSPRAWGEDWNRDQAASSRDRDRPVPLSGHAKVRSSATEGRHKIDVSCDGHGHPDSGSFDIVRQARSDHRSQPDDQSRSDHQSRTDHHSQPGHHSRPDHYSRPDHHSRPTAPVRAGGGGTAQLAAESGEKAASGDKAGSPGPGTQHAVIGLVLAGVAAVAVAFRSVRRNRTGARDSD